MTINKKFIKSQYNKIYIKVDKDLNKYNYLMTFYTQFIYA